jgi:hypothetical protein
MPEAESSFVRQKVGVKGLMCLVCLRCGNVVAHSDRPEALAIAEAVHAKVCKGPVPAAAPKKRSENLPR